MHGSERNRRRRWALALLLCAAGALAPRVATAESGAESARTAEARAVVETTANRVLEILRDEELSESVKQERIRELAYARFDFDTIAKLVLARNWRRLSAEERQEFVEEFKRHLALTYGGNLDEYRNEAVEIEGSRLERNGDVTVRTRLVGRPEPILVDYRLRELEGKWRVIDVIIEGVSMISNFRSQTREIIHEQGARGLIETLREKNAAREKEAAES